MAIGDGTGPSVVRCYECVFWWQPDGQPITPEFGREGLSKQWWAATGLCIRVAPFSSKDRPHSLAEWFVTNADHGCGDGETVVPVEPTRGHDIEKAG